jgi:predicted transposase YbfD/YdcC
VGIVIYAAGTSPNLPEFSFYGGTETLRFNAAEWKYYRRVGDLWVPLDGVTNIVKLITPSKPLMVWAVRKALEKTKKLLMDGGYVYLDGDTKSLYESVLDEILAKAKQADTEELEDAGEVGHVAHDHIEKIIKSILVNDEDRRMELLAKLPVDDRSANGAIAAICWIVEHKVRFISTERRVFDRQHDFAGTCDGVAWVSSCNDPKCCPKPWIGERLSIIDWKTSNALRVSYLWQTAAYQNAIESEDGIQILDRWILRLDKETADFDPWYREGRAAFEEDFAGFLNALATHRSLEKSEDWVSEIKSARTAERRRIARELRDAVYAIKCLDADEYKGVRKKKGCNGTEKMCLACQEIYDVRRSEKTTCDPAV